MKVVGMKSPGPGIDIFEMDEPTIKNDELLVEVKSASICGSDMHWYRWDTLASNRNVTFPTVLGHELSGIVIQKGDKVESFDIGDHVSVETHIPCKKCMICRTGKQHLCSSLAIFGMDTLYGAFCERVPVPEQIAVKIPKSIPFDEAACLEPLGVVLNTLAHTGIQPGNTIAILGCGPLGLMLQKIALNIGAGAVFATDISEYRLNIAKKLDVDMVINSFDTDPVAAIKDRLEGYGVDIVVEASGSKEAVKQALELVNPGGTVVQLGTVDPVEINLMKIVLKEVIFTGNFGREMFSTWERAIRLVESKRYSPGHTITHKFPFSEAEMAFSLLDQGKAGKVLLVP